MTRNEARGILIRMQSEIENPYSTEAQALGIAIEKMERDYETEYWESQWKIDQYEGSLAAASVARKELEKLYENLYTEMYAEYCDLQRTHQRTMDASADACKVENRPIDERKDEGRIIYRLEKIEARMDDLGCSVEYLKGVAEAQAERLAKIRKAFNE